MCAVGLVQGSVAIDTAAMAGGAALGALVGAALALVAGVLGTAVWPSRARSM